MADTIPTDYQERLTCLTAELDDLRQRGGPTRVFDRLEDHGPRDLIILFDLVRRRHADMWANESQRVDAIKQVLADGIKHLPQHSLPGAKNGTLSWPKAALILFNIYVPPDAAAAVQGYKGQMHAKLARYVREDTGLTDPGIPKSELEKRAEDRQFQRIVLEMRKKMAERILKAVSSDNAAEPKEDCALPRVEAEPPSTTPNISYNIANATNSAFGPSSTVINTVNYHAERNDGQPAAE